MVDIATARQQLQQARESLQARRQEIQSQQLASLTEAQVRAQTRESAIVREQQEQQFSQQQEQAVQQLQPVEVELQRFEGQIVQAEQVEVQRQQAEQQIQDFEQAKKLFQRGIVDPGASPSVRRFIAEFEAGREGLILRQLESQASVQPPEILQSIPPEFAFTPIPPPQFTPIPPTPTRLEQVRLKFESVERELKDKFTEPVFQLLEKGGITSEVLSKALVSSPLQIGTPISMALPTQQQSFRTFQEGFIKSQIDDLRESPLENIALVVGGGVAGKVVKGIRGVTLSTKGAQALAKTDKALGVLGAGAGTLFTADVALQLKEATNVDDVSRILGLSTKDALLFIGGFKIGERQFFTFPRGKKGATRFSELETFFKKEAKKKSGLNKDDLITELQFKREGGSFRARTRQEKLDEITKILNKAREIEDPLQRKEFIREARDIFESSFGKQTSDELIREFAVQEGLFTPTQTEPQLRIETLEQLESLIAQAARAAPVGVGITQISPGQEQLPESLRSPTSLFIKSQQEMEQDTRQDLPQVILTKQQTQQKIKQNQILGSAAQSLLSQKVIQKQKAAQRTKQVLALKMAQKLVTKQKARKILKLKFPKGIPLSKIPPIKKLQSDPFSFKKGKVRKGVQAYDVLIKRFGKFRKIADDLPFNRAKRFGALVTNRNLGATYKIVKDKKGKVRVKDIKPFKPNPKIYRSFKTVKGKKVPLKNKWIEKRGSRLNTKTEVAELKAFKKRTRKKTKRRKKK